MVFWKKDYRAMAQDALERGDHHEAIDHFEAHLTRTPDDAAGRKICADLYCKTGRFQGAIPHYEALAGSYAENGLVLKAIAASKAILDIDPDHLDTLKSLGDLCEARGTSIDEVLSDGMRKGLKSATPPYSDDDILDADDLLDSASGEGYEEFSLDDDLLVGISDEGEDLDETDLTQIPLFSGLPSKAFTELVTQTELWRSTKDTAILRQGEQGDSFFVVVSGRVRIERNDAKGKTQALGTLQNGAFFGEAALLSKHPRSASVVADTDVELLEIKEKTLNDLRSRYESVDKTVRRFFRLRLIENAMRGDLFRDLPLPVRKDFLRAFRDVEHTSETFVVTQGEQSDALFVVLSGKLAVVKDTQEIAVLDVGDVFGEIGLLLEQPASADVKAKEDVRLLRLSRGGFAKVLDKHAGVKQKLEDLALARVDENA